MATPLTPQQLAANAVCFDCIPNNMREPIRLYLLNQIFSNSVQGGTGSVLCGAVDPTVAPSVTCAIYYNTVTNSWWYWSGTAWVNKVSAAVFLAAVGTAALPSYTFNGDLATGMFHPAVSQVGFSTAGVQQMNLNADGTLNFISSVQLSDRIRLTGLDFFGSPSLPDGISILLGTNLAANRQMLIADSALLAVNAVNQTLRFLPNAGLIDSVATNVITPLPLIVGNFGSVTTFRGTSISFPSVISIPAGANRRAGNLTLVGGTQTVANTTVTANTLIFLTRKSTGGTIGFAITYTLNPGVGFTVTSDNALDTSTYSYLCIENP